MVIVNNAQDRKIKIDAVFKVADVALRGPYSSEKFGNVIIPMAILRRLDCVMNERRDEINKVLEATKNLEEKHIKHAMKKMVGIPFFNKTQHSFASMIKLDQAGIRTAFLEYINGFSSDVKDLIEYLNVREEVKTLDKFDRLHAVIKEFAAIDFSLATTDDLAMGYIFEEIIRKFKQNAEAGDHYTGRDIIELMVEMLLSEQADEILVQGKTLQIYDCCCGTGGMLTVARKKVLAKLQELYGKDYIEKHKQDVQLFGQEVNKESYAICLAEILMMNLSPDHIVLDDTLTADGFPNKQFDLLITNPPFGIDWKTSKNKIEDEMELYNSRFFATPRTSDGQLLFMQNMLSKLTKKGRMAIITNGSPLSTGGVVSGESQIRKYLIENDLLECIVAMPKDMFYNTGIDTYIWIINKNKSDKRKGKIQLINASEDEGYFYSKLPSSLGKKRNEFTLSAIENIVTEYNNFAESEYCKIFDNNYFGYTQITIEQAMLDDNGKVKKDKKGKIVVDKSKRDTEIVPLTKNIQEYFLVHYKC